MMRMASIFITEWHLTALMCHFRIVEWLFTALKRHLASAKWHLANTDSHSLYSNTKEADEADVFRDLYIHVMI